MAGGAGVDHTRRARVAGLPHGLHRALARLADMSPGTMLEPKGPAIAIHYRAVPDQGHVLEERIAELLVSHGGRMKMLRGKCVFEIKDAAINKGTAVERFMSLPAFAGRRPVAVGDDVTDEDAFGAVDARGGLSVLIGRSPTQLSGSRARYGLPDPASVLAWIERIGPMEGRRGMSRERQ